MTGISDGQEQPPGRKTTDPDDPEPAIQGGHSDGCLHAESLHGPAPLEEHRFTWARRRVASQTAHPFATRPRGEHEPSAAGPFHLDGAHDPTVGLPHDTDQWVSRGNTLRTKLSSRSLPSLGQETTT